LLDPVFAQRNHERQDRRRRSADFGSQAEAPLAVEIACLHAACGNLLGRLTWTMQERPTMAAANATAKHERALHSAIKTYLRLKHGNTQVIRIERIEIQGGAQAVVGAVVRP
jgi:hypothetical protein